MVTCRREERRTRRVRRSHGRRPRASRAGTGRRARRISRRGRRPGRERRPPTQRRRRTEAPRDTGSGATARKRPGRRVAGAAATRSDHPDAGAAVTRPEHRNSGAAAPRSGHLDSGVAPPMAARGSDCAATTRSWRAVYSDSYGTQRAPCFGPAGAARSQPFIPVDGPESHHAAGVLRDFDLRASGQGDFRARTSARRGWLKYNSSWSFLGRTRMCRRIRRHQSLHPGARQSHAPRP